MARFYQKGFTFIEVMISLLIVALVFSSFLSATNNYISNTTNLQQRIWAQQLAWNTILTLHRTTFVNQISDNTSEETFMDQTWFVERKVTPTVTSELVKVDILVGFVEDQPITSLSTFIIIENPSN